MWNDENESNALPEHFVPKSLWETATLGMGCFWSPEALFGHLPGVVRTRTGYAGGTMADPDYRRMGDHSEMVQIDYDPRRISYGQLLQVFWDRHNPVNINGYKDRQYLSLILFHHKEQEREIHETVSRMRQEKPGIGETEIQPYTVFYQAEERHQKYYLKRFPDAMEKLQVLYPTDEALELSTLASRLNGLAKGFTSLERIMRELETWPISEPERIRITETIGSIRW